MSEKDKHKHEPLDAEKQAGLDKLRDLLQNQQGKTADTAITEDSKKRLDDLKQTWNDQVSKLVKPGEKRH